MSGGLLDFSSLVITFGLVLILVAGLIWLLGNSFKSKPIKTICRLISTVIFSFAVVLLLDEYDLIDTTL